jgi:hypothetical protein
MGGPGDDVSFSLAFFLLFSDCLMQVEVTMIDEPPHAGKKHRDIEKGVEGMGHLMRDGVMGFHFGKRYYCWRYVCQ